MSIFIIIVGLLVLAILIMKEYYKDQARMNELYKKRYMEKLAKDKANSNKSS